MTLDFMPSPSREDPGLFIRDPYKFSAAMLIVPPPLVECLQCFDGRHTDLDLRAVLARITGRLETEEIARNLTETLSNAGFLEDEIFEIGRAGYQPHAIRISISAPSWRGSPGGWRRKKSRAILPKRCLTRASWKMRSS